MSVSSGSYSNILAPKGFVVFDQLLLCLIVDRCTFPGCVTVASQSMQLIMKTPKFIPMSKGSKAGFHSNNLRCFSSAVAAPLYYSTAPSNSLYLHPRNSHKQFPLLGTEHNLCRHLNCSMPGILNINSEGNTVFKVSEARSFTAK